MDGNSSLSKCDNVVRVWTPKQAPPVAVLDRVIFCKRGQYQYLPCSKDTKRILDCPTETVVIYSLGKDEAYYLYVKDLISNKNKCYIRLCIA